MRLIKPSFEIWEQDKPNIKLGMLGSPAKKPAYLLPIYKQIEKAGRTCYKSEDKITEDSCWEFVDRMVASKHYAMLEHGTVYLTIVIPKKAWNHVIIDKYYHNPYSKCNNTFDDNDYYYYITTNLRVIAENNWWDDLQYISTPTEHHEKRITVKYTTNIQVYKEYTRHRVMSWAIESTRYCNYFKEKFGHSVNFVYPCWLKEDEVEEFEQDLTTIENIYFKWIEKGWQAQQAATFLPQATKAEVIMTGFISDWQHFLDLRALGTTGAPHPQAKELAYPLYEEFIKRGYISK